jgi:hypothetical protein
MKIQYTNFVSDPSLRNTVTHLPNHVAQVLIASGQAVEIKLPFRSAPGWAEARQEQSRVLSGGRASSHDVVAPWINGVEWSLGNQSISNKPCVFRKSGNECARFLTVEQAKEYGAPKELVAQFRAALDKSENEHGAGVAVGERYFEQQQSRERERSGIDRLFNR